MQDKTYTTRLGEKLTFIVQVQFRSNATWQGSITWVEQQRTQQFRSTLEMVKLMDSAMNTIDDSSFNHWM